MSDQLFDSTKIASYFLWEYTQAENALALWVCAEDTSNFLESSGIFNQAQISAIIEKGIFSYEYIEFIRHIAFRIFVYTGHDNAEGNWYTAEKLIRNHEWCAAVVQIANIFSENKTNFESLPGVRSEQVKQNYL